MRPLLSILAVLALGTACSVGAANGDDAGGTAGVGGTEPGPDLPQDLRIDAVQPLDARAEVDLVVRASPGRSYPVRFSLPMRDGDPKDALLDRWEAMTDASGRATVRLTAPSTVTSFDVRATVGGVVVATRRIEVVSSVTATLQVQPVATGRRVATTWVATVHEGATCAEVPGVPPEDGSKRAFASADQAPELQGVMTGVPLAVTLRSGFYMGGCASLQSLPPEAADTPQIVEVTVLERPIDLAESSLSLSLGLADPETTWSDVVRTTTTEVVTATKGNGVNDADALLDGMRDALTGTAQQSLENARTVENWDTTVLARWGSDSKLRDLMTAWLNGGAAKLTAGDSAFVGTIVPSSSKKAHLTLETVAGVPADAAGFISPTSVSWTAGPDDTIVLATDLYFVRSQLVTALAEPEALADFAGTTSAGEALASALECTALAADLAAAGTDPVLAYAGCGAACLRSLCEASLAGIWQRARDATASTPARLSVSAAGNGRVGDAAQLAGILGTWVGKVTIDGVEHPTGGPLTAAEPLQPPP